MTCRNDVWTDLLKSEALLSKVFHDSPFAICLSEMPDGKSIYVNNAFEKLTGYTISDVAGKTLADLDMIRPNQLQEVLASSHNSETQLQKELLLQIKNGKTCTVLLYFDDIHFNDHRYLIFTFMDITKRKEMEQEIQYLDRLNLISDMAVSLAHHIRNPLTTVKGYLQLLKRKADLQSYESRFTTMIDEMDIINRIVTEFITLAKNKTVHREPNELNHLLYTLVPLIEADAAMQGKIVKLDLNAITPFSFDQKEMTQLILHMARNGLEAMEAGGTLTIQTKIGQSAVLLLISDEGCGISSEVLPRLGEPFVSTKAGGMGLGLTICKQVLKHHQAEWIYETSPRGTTFTISFPTCKNNSRSEISS